MKKILLGVAIGTALSLSLSAAASTKAVGSNITGVQLWIGEDNLMTAEAPGSFSGLAFGGTATDADNDNYVDSANLTFSGLIDFTRYDLDIRLTFDLIHGDYVPSSGILFDEGTIRIDVQLDGEWQNYGAIDASTAPLYFIANQPGHLATSGFPAQVTTGIVRNTLPGLWDGVTGSGSFNRGAAAFVLLGQATGFYMQGEIFTTGGFEGEGHPLFGPPEVPVPSAVWLFGSALAGLVGARRWRG
jgi:hypothetical protein